jgi:hypothetical protein
MKKINIAIVATVFCNFCIIDVSAFIQEQLVFTLTLNDRNSLDPQGNPASRQIQQDLDLNQWNWPVAWDLVNAILNRPHEMYRLPAIQTNVSAFDTSLCHICGSGGRGLSHIHVPIEVNRENFQRMKNFPNNWNNVGRDWILFGNATTDRDANGVKAELEQAIRHYREPNVRGGYAPTHDRLANWNIASDRLQALAQRFWNYENTAGFDPVPDPAPKQFSCCTVTIEEDVRPSGLPGYSATRILKSIKIRFDRIFQQRGRQRPQIQEWHDFLTQGFPAGNPYHEVAADLNTIGYNAVWNYNNRRYFDEGSAIAHYASVIYNQDETNIVIVTLVVGINLNDGADFRRDLAIFNNADTTLPRKIGAIAALLRRTPDNWHVCSFYIR